jgi:ATP-dependent helicase/nuclease subunit A
MTRARDRLIVCGPQFRNGEDKDCWRAAIEQALDRLGAEEIETPFGKGKRYGAVLTTDAQAAAPHAQIALPEWAKTPAPGSKRIDIAAPSRLHRIDPALFSPRRDGQKRFRRGRMIHGLLQRLPEVEPAKRSDAAHAWLKRQGVDVKEAEAYATEALKVIDDPRFAAVFAPSSRAEAPIIGEAAGRAVRGIVDRLAIASDHVLVLDFKTDRPAPQTADATPDDYVLQLALYRAVLRQIFPGRAVRCALLWTEAPAILELPDSRLDAVFETFSRG